MKATRIKYYHIALISLLLFAFRVIAQLIQFISPINFLPAFSTWQSGALPYGILLPIQLVMLQFMIGWVSQLKHNKIIPTPELGQKLIWFGIFYLLIMIFRMVAGQTFAQEHYWLNAPLPTIFHYVLAAYILCFGHYHSNYHVKGEGH